MSDTFADLWNYSAPKKQPPTSVKYSLQDALAAKQVENKKIQSRAATPATVAPAWDGLETLANSLPPPSSTLLDDDIQDDILGELGRPISKVETQKIRSRAVTPATVTDGLEAFANPLPPPPLGLLDDDIHDDILGVLGRPISKVENKTQSLANSLPPPALSDDDDHDDILGELSRPIESIHSVRLSFLHRTPPIIWNSHLLEQALIELAFFCRRHSSTFTFSAPSYLLSLSARFPTPAHPRTTCRDGLFGSTSKSRTRSHRNRC